MDEILRLAIPLLALLIPVLAVTGHYVIQPLAKALARLAEQEDRLADRQIAELAAAELAARLERMEEVLSGVVEEQEFQRALQAQTAPGVNDSRNAAGADDSPEGPRFFLPAGGEV